MAIEINRLRKSPENGEYVSDMRICITEDGEIVACDDPRAARLLVGEGSTIPAPDAARYGLIVEVAEAPAEPDDAGGDEEAPAEPAQPDAKRRK